MCGGNELHWFWRWGEPVLLGDVGGGGQADNAENTSIAVADFFLVRWLGGEWYFQIQAGTFLKW